MLRTSERLRAKEEQGRQCASIWETGKPNKPAEDAFPPFFKPSTNCTYRVDGQLVYITYPSDRQKIIDYIHAVERFDENTLQTTAPNGIYTWILYKKKDDSATYFAATQVKSIVEMGTLHYAIARGVEAATVHGAGELKKVGKDITFNFLSGSFMQTWIPAKALCSLPEMEVFIRDNHLKPKFPRANVMFTKETIISKQFLKVPTMEEIQSYADKGFVVCIHPKENVDECKSVKGTCANPLKPTEEAMAKTGGDMSIQGKSIQISSRPESQASKARKVFASQGLLENPRTPMEQSLQELKRPITPGSVGLGRKRRTRRSKKRRQTRRRL